MTVQTDMELSYVAVQATGAKEENCGLGRHHTRTFIAGGMWVIVFMMLGGCKLAVQVL